jgi:hypothetical protein
MFHAFSIILIALVARLHQFDGYVMCITGQAMLLYPQPQQVLVD